MFLKFSWVIAVIFFLIITWLDKMSLLNLRGSVIKAMICFFFFFKLAMPNYYFFRLNFFNVRGISRYRRTFIESIFRELEESTKVQNRR